MKELWQGRYDSDESCDLRFWQVVRKFSEAKEGACIVGYNTDDGVARNKGRIGAKDGSNFIRKAMGSFAAFEGLRLSDYGNLSAFTLENAQLEYAEKIYDILNKQMLPIGIGGGHDIAFGSYSGIRKKYKNEKIAIINFDTHLDMRPYEEQTSSGTSFKQILDNDKNVKYAIIGFQQLGNTKRLIDLAKKYSVLMIKEEENLQEIHKKIQNFIKDVDLVYVTFCMDVFDVSFAPGVSAPSVMGLEPKVARALTREIIKTKKLCCVDFAEVNPLLDQDNITAKLAGSFIYDILFYTQGVCDEN